MVFSSSVPVYLDPPNWHQQPNQQQVVPSDESSQQLPPLPPPQLGGGATASSIRPGSMAERARLAKIPQPEVALKCPRCESTNTKFCYFNNYSLTQPRHFCKTCRRYWTRGGALRSVPVGGGCRRNKKSKSQTSSKSSSGSSEKQMSSSNSSSTSAAIPQLPFMSSLNNFAQFGVGNLGLSFGGISQGQIGSITSGANAQTDMGIFHMGINSGMQQFPFLETSQNNGLYPNFQSAETPSSTIVGDSQLGSMDFSGPRVSQLGPVKTEENRGLNFSRPFLGISENNNQFWGGNSWTDLSGLNSSSTSHLL